MSESEKKLSGVSICMATYNAEGFISRTLDSILNQTYSNFRCIVCDDASSDRTMAICQSYANIDRRIELYRHKQRLGWIGNVNRALAYSSGGYLMIAPHDDVMAPSYLGTLVAALEKNRNAVIAFSNIEEVYPAGGRKLSVYDELDGITSSMVRALRVLKREGCWWVPYRGVIRAAVYNEIGSLRRHATGEFAADWPWMLRLAIAGEFVRVPYTLYTKYRRLDSVSSDWEFNVKDWMSAFYSCLQVVTNSKLSTAQTLWVYTRLFPHFAGSAMRVARQKISLHQTA